MNKLLNILSGIVLLILLILNSRAPFVFSILILFAASQKYIALVPALVVAMHVFIGVGSIKSKNEKKVLSVFLSIILICISILGHFHDFTAYDSSGPGLWEWINLQHLLFTVPILLVLTIRFSIKSKT